MNAPPDYDSHTSTDATRPGTPQGMYRASDGQFYPEHLKPQNWQAGPGGQGGQGILSVSPDTTAITRTALGPGISRMVLSSNMMTMMWHPYSSSTKVNAVPGSGAGRAQSGDANSGRVTVDNVKGGSLEFGLTDSNATPTHPAQAHGYPPNQYNPQQPNYQKQMSYQNQHPGWGQQQAHPGQDIYVQDQRGKRGGSGGMLNGIRECSFTLPGR